MALKTKVKREDVVSEEDGNVEWINDKGKMMKLPAKDVEIVETSPEGEAAADQANTAEQAAQSEEEGADEQPAPEPETQAPPPKPKKEKAPPKAKQAAKAAPAKPAKAAAPAPAPAPEQVQSTSADKPAKPVKEKTVAKAKAKAKTAKGVRTIGGKEVDLSKYSKVKAPGGGVSFNNGDSTAKKLEGKTLDEVYKIVAKDTKQDEKELRAKYKHLNPGMQRMSLGNMHRKGPREAKAAKKSA